MAFPPVPVYPKAIDSDYTLYFVHNTTETRLGADNSPWAQEIDIVPVAPDRPEIWANNGFANIEGELLYYDSVELDAHGKVKKLKACARQIGGKTQFNKRGTWIRSFVVAEHHNQLLDCVFKTQKFIGYNFTPDISTLDWRIRNLRALAIIFDDYSCPDVDFTFNITANDPVLGITATYSVVITPPSTINSFRLDFGDGDFTTTDLTGTHQYALNATIDPVVSVSNDKCQILQTPIERSNPQEPPNIQPVTFSIPIPEIPTVPDFNFVPCDVPQPDINLPALVTPCVSIEGQVGPIPSVITGPTIQMVSQVVITGPDNPINITQSQVTIIGGDNIPSIIVIDPPIPPTIIIDPPIPPTIVIIPPQSNITLDIDFAEMPRLEVDWGNIPQNLEVALTMAQQVKTPQKFATDPTVLNEFGTEFADLFDVSKSMQVQYESVGIPSQIMVVHPEDGLKIDTTELFEKKIQVEATGVILPSDIFIHGPDSPIPNSIVFDASQLPEDIDLVYRGKPIPVEVTGMPTTVRVEMEKTIPERVIVEIPKPIPEKIVIEHNIPAKIIYDGPISLPVFVPEDTFLPVKFPDKMPEMELVYRGAPIEFKITMDQINGTTEGGEPRNCFMMVPCPVK